MYSASPSHLPSESVKILTEQDIQDRLYGRYHVKKKQPKLVSQPVVATMTAATVPQWTGTEILAGELKRLRQELIELRDEKDKLMKEIQRAVPVKEPEVVFSVVDSNEQPGRSAWRVFSGVVAVFLMLGVVGIAGYPVGVKLLQASPVGMIEAAPFTIQVAVYDVRSMADKALGYLQELGYPAFVVETLRRDGNARYRIYVGQYITRVEAQLEEERLKADPRFADAFVRIQ